MTKDQSLREGWDEAEGGVETAKRLKNFKLKDGAKDWRKERKINIQMCVMNVKWECPGLKDENGDEPSPIISKYPVPYGATQAATKAMKHGKSSANSLPKYITQHFGLTADNFKIAKLNIGCTFEGVKNLNSYYLIYS